MPDSASKAKSCAPIATMCPDVQGTTSMEMLVGSQKRKARKSKITHLVRTADGSVSPAEGEDQTLFDLHETLVAMEEFCAKLYYITYIYSMYLFM